MHENTKKIVLVGHLLLAALGAWLIHYGAIYIFKLPSIKLEDRIADFDMMMSIAAVVVGVVFYLYLSKNVRIKKFSEEVVEEFYKVTWPGMIEVRGATIVVTIFILLTGVLFWIFDLGINSLIKLILGAN